ncbi:sensor histidine kinase [Nocardioides nanhaiensis]|uniref:histidine kinase n=1 Tax=Nocardioides nanhaiensis TaxID=1476871 RepID=A0ABP8VRE9_9ACTN
MWSREARRAERRSEPTLARQFLVLQLVVVAVLLLIVGVVSVRQSNATFTTERGSQLGATAEYVANLATVRDGLEEAQEPGGSPLAANALLAPSVDRGLSLSGADEILLVGLDGSVLSASDPALLGEPALLGASDALERGRRWTGEVETAEGRVLAAHAPVLSVPPTRRDGTSTGEPVRLLGIVVAEQAYPSVGAQLGDAGSELALFLGLGALLGIVGSVVVSRVLARRTQGLGAAELARLADHREALLHSIREGVVAVDTEGRVSMVNDAALDLLGLDGLGGGAAVLGRPVDELGLEPHVVELLTGASQQRARDAVALVGTRVLVLNRRSAEAGGTGIGSVTTMRDRTELVSVQEQLSTNLTITDTLRAQTHEFDNKLHVISGLVQLGEYDEVRAVIGDITRQRSEVEGLVSARVGDRAVAALLVAKHSVAAERGVALRIDDASRLGPLPASLGADVTTVLGNLVDNAVDAVAGRPDPWVEVLVRDDGGEVSLQVGDHGPGVAPHLREEVFVRGYSTKPGALGGRGIGLPLVRLISTQRGGSVAVGEAPGGGAEFEVVLPLTAEERQSRAAERQEQDQEQQGVAR